MLDIVDIIKPLLKKGQSVYQILKNHPEIKMCSKTLYMYIESGIFQDYGINNFSLRRQVSMRKRKKLKKRKEPVNYEGRRYKDYLEFVEKNPTIPTTQMDTVYNQQEGPYIQTFIFQNTRLMIGFLHTEKTSESMASTLDHLQVTLENDYYKLFSLNDIFMIPNHIKKEIDNLTSREILKRAILIRDIDNQFKVRKNRKITFKKKILIIMARY